MVAGLVLGAFVSWICVSWIYRAALRRAGLLDDRGRLVVDLKTKRGDSKDG